METKSGMAAIRSGFLLCALAAVSHPQALDLRGRVVNGSGAPVSGASVDLDRLGVSGMTSMDGSFALTGTASLTPGPERDFAYALRGGFLDLHARIPLELRMEILASDGRVQGRLVRRLAAGPHRIRLAEAFPAPMRAPGLSFLRLRLGTRTKIHAFFRSGPEATGAVFAPDSRRIGNAKISSAVDTLRIRKAGYRDLAVALGAYAAGDLGDLAMTAGEGAVCARQRPERAPDGSAYILCEALFDRPPRVHPPAASPGYAYAAMTAEAFVAVTGESYPHATRGALEPESRRHASALYEVKIVDGKPAAYRPAILFAESLFLEPLKGRAFEGLISKRTGGRYEPAPSLPVRVRVSGLRFEGKAGGASDFELEARIENLESPVAASDGTCLPALAGYGPQAPFEAGSGVVLSVGRVPSMHTFGDDELVFSLHAGGASLGSLMSRSWFLGPLDLLRDAYALSGPYEGTGHGSPGYIPMLSLHPAMGGGGACATK